VKNGEQTRAKLVETTGRLLQTQGYFGTGVAEILRNSGSPRGSFYFHFPGGKEELACEALRASGAAWRQKIEAAAAGTRDPAEALLAVCNMLADELVASDYREGCPLATVALEAAATTDAVHEVCTEHFAGWEKLVAERIAAVGVPEPMRPTVATLILSAIEGAQLLCRAHRSPEPLHRVAEALATMLRNFVPAQPRT
jgi:TetR/AcrR family transcriptional repressor of lmrAB and yxaGH operons